MVPPAPPQGMELNTSSNKRNILEEPPEKQVSIGHKAVQSTANCFASTDNANLRIQIPPTSTVQLESPLGAVQNSDYGNPDKTKTPKPSLRAPGLPAVIGRLNLSDGSCTSTRRELQFSIANNLDGQNDPADPVQIPSPKCPRTPFHFRSQSQSDTISGSIGWSSKRSRIDVARKLDYKKHKTSRISDVMQQMATPQEPTAPTIPSASSNSNFQGDITPAAGIDCSKLQEKHVELKAYSQRRAKHTTQTHSKQQPSGDNVLYSSALGMHVASMESSYGHKTSSTVDEMILTHSDYRTSNTLAAPKWDSSPTYALGGSSSGMDLLAAVASGSYDSSIDRFAHKINRSIFSSSSTRLPPTSEADGSPSEKTHKPARAPFQRLSVDEPDVSDVYTTYDTIQK
ncbi:uncharacterized protein [Triticum aestivum]|uniref:uncharacterized protein isoform X2 n=1 Tax=Triticum aestivum TaxID=4565 RepID=UPI001D01A36A|nr:uncharacterized protein LOC123059965 isoform X2 [Triticum aestivum]